MFRKKKPRFAANDTDMSIRSELALVQDAVGYRNSRRGASFFLECVRTEERPLGPQRLSRVRDGAFFGLHIGDEKMVAIRFVALSAAPATRIVAHKALILAAQA